MVPDVAKTASPLALLSEIASRLAEGDEIVATVGDVMHRLLRAFNATEVSLWLYASGSLRRSAIAGAPFLSESDVQSAVDTERQQPGLVARRLASRDHRIGILTVGGASALTADANNVLTIVANLVAPWLAHAEDMHRLTGEVARSARQVEDERKMTARIIDALPLGLYVVDRDYRVQAWNSNREIGSQGVSRERAMGQLIFDVLHRQSRDELRAQFDEVFNTGRIQQFNIDSQASGQRRTYRMSKIPMRIDDGPVTHVISIGEETTFTILPEWRRSGVPGG